MAKLQPLANLNDNGAGVADIEGLLVAATETTNTFTNDNNVMYFVANGSGAAITATLKSVPDPYGRGGTGDENTDETISVPAGGVGFFPQLNPASWGADATVVLSSITTVKHGVIRMRKLR